MFSRMFGLAFGAWFGLAAANADGPGLVLLVLVGMFACYRAGRWRRPPSSIAVAQARSQATSAVQVNVHPHPDYPRPEKRPRDPELENVHIDAGELAGNIAGELDPGEPLEGYVEWLGHELTRAASSETPKP